MLGEIKMCCNILSLIMKMYFDNIHGTDFGIDHLNNRLNPDMNNVMAIDHANRDWIDDTDTLMNRMAMEFPRISQGYKSKHTFTPALK